MMAEISPAVIKKTQDTLGKFVKKPALSEKLLKKPPFKFLHDVINVVIKNTGFLNGLYTDEELQSENIKDRDAKIAFLQKAVDTVKLATNQNLTVRPSKIVAGLEPEKTNEFLQAIGKAIQNKVGSSQAVQAVITGQTPSNDKKKEVKKESKTSTKPKAGNAEGKEVKTKLSEPKKTTHTKDAKAHRQSSKEVETKDTIKRKNSKNNIENKIERKNSDSKANKTEKSSPTARQLNEKRGSESNLIKVSNETENTIAATENTKEDARRISESIENKEVTNTDTKKNGDNDNETMNDDNNLNSIIHDANSIDDQNINDTNISNNNKTLASDKTKIISETVDNNGMKQTDKKHNRHIEQNQTKKLEAKDSRNSIDSTENLTNMKLEKTKSDGRLSDRNEKSMDEEKKEETELDKLTRTATNKKTVVKSMSINDENGQSVIRPSATLRSAAGRPVSARPGAPRRKDRNVKILEIENFTRDTAEAANTNRTNFNKEFIDDGENLITIDDNILPEENAQEAIAAKDMNLDQNKQGHLVQQILETQTVFSKIENDAKNDSARLKEMGSKSIIERQLSAKKMSYLRESIQKLTRYITPLGKLMEYFQEDVDAMQIELSMWQNTYSALEMEIKNEQGLTEKLLEPFKYQLVGIENNIKDYREQINNLSANLIHNEEKILKLIVDL